MHRVLLISKSLALLALMHLLSAQGAFGGQVQLVWDLVDDPAVIGYKVYYGTDSRNYTHVQDVQTDSSYLATGLSDTRTYYFAVTSYAANGESSYSDELIYSPAGIQTTLEITPLLYILLDDS